MYLFSLQNYLVYKTWNTLSTLEVQLGAPRSSPRLSYLLYKHNSYPQVHAFKLYYLIRVVHNWLRVSSKDWFYCFCCSVKIIIVFIGYFSISSVLFHYITDFRTSVLSETETLFTSNFFQLQDNKVTPVIFFLLDACQHCKKQNSLLSCRKCVKSQCFPSFSTTRKPRCHLLQGKKKIELSGVQIYKQRQFKTLIIEWQHKSDFLFTTWYCC